MDEKARLLEVPLLSASSMDRELPRSRWRRLQHGLVPLVLDIAPDIALGSLVQYSRDDPGARIMTAFAFAGIVQGQVVAALQLSLTNKVDALRTKLADPLTRKELWVYTQAAWLVYMTYIPFAAVVCGYTAWAARDAIFGQNADVADVVASLLIINLISLPFSLGSAMMRSELETQNSLHPWAIVMVISWTIGLTFAYVLGYWTPLGFVGIAFTDVITYAIQFRMLVPKTNLLAQWPGWQLRQAVALMPQIACHPAMVCVLLVNLSMMLFGFMSLLASLIKVDEVIQLAQTNIFPSLLMLTFAPLFAVCLDCSLSIKAALGHGAEPVISRNKLALATGSVTAIASLAWVVGGLHVGVDKIHPSIVAASQTALSALVPLFPSLGFVFVIRPVFRTCTELWDHASTVFLLTMAIGAALGTMFAEVPALDGRIQGLWYGQYLGVIGFILITTAGVTSKKWWLEPHREAATVLHQLPADVA